MGGCKWTAGVNDGEMCNGMHLMGRRGGEADVFHDRVKNGKKR